MNHKSPDRNAGILLHITSLPSPYGIGDLGYEAHDFSGFLSRSNQRYWQLLPLNPVDGATGYSPYSSQSAMAGNYLLISPDVLVAEGLLDATDTGAVRSAVTGIGDFDKAADVKKELFRRAFTRAELADEHFTEYCRRNQYWLDDFALYKAIKRSYNGLPWNEWEAPLKFREKKALSAFTKAHATEIAFIKWLQFIFDRQYAELKRKCNSGGIRIIGDLPFYISYDSADVWSNPSIFQLDDQLRMKFVAGVPPDYFNDEGQLWGMPVYNWDALKQKKYAWWIQRIRRNMEWYDLLRLDHFRAFRDYWIVPEGEKTAKTGEWKDGPGSDFFRSLKKSYGSLPFLAEDLGDIHAGVYELRDEFSFPGMKVLQFAFGNNITDSVDIPHNYPQNSFVYSGTHDNNTATGWYRTECPAEDKWRLSEYAGYSVNEHNVGDALIRLAFRSVAKTAIIPLQDYLGLDEHHRMNKPASENRNWVWRLEPGKLTPALEERIRTLTWIYGREQKAD